MKNVLWISRHKMTQPQMEDLERAMGQSVRLRQWGDTVHEIESLRSAVEEADVIAAVLPVELLAQLLKLADGKPVLQSVSERTPTGRILTLADGQKEPEFAYVHRCWQQILVLEIQVKCL